MSEASIAAGTKNMIPFSQRTEGEALLLRRRGGKQKSVVKTEAHKWRGIRERIQREAATKEDADWMIGKLQDRSTASADILLYLEEIKKSVHPGQRIALANAMKDLAKFQHGDKVQVESVNVNINTTLEEWERRMREE
jgi:hypothetical protein